MGLLDDILAQKRQELDAVRQLIGPFAPRDALHVLRREANDPLRLAAEIKFKSPSAGELSTVLSIEERALAYAECGTSLVSVLCDERFFGGSYAHVSQVRSALERAGHHTRILAKEFVIDEAQVRAAATMGADAVLLIVRILEPAMLASLTAYAIALGIEPLVEVATEPELALAISSGARLIGVNARNLDTLRVDAQRAKHVLEQIPAGIVAMHLSGLRSPFDVQQIAKGRTDAALVGEALMRTADPRPLLTAMLVAAASERR